MSSAALLNVSLLLGLTTHAACPQTHVGQPHADSVRTFTASAYEIDSGGYLFDEEHREGYRQGRLRWSQITYRDRNGVILARKSLGFGDNLLIPEVQLTDRRDGYFEGATVQDGALVLYRGVGKGTPDRRILRIDDATVVDGGLHNLILQRWDDLLEGETVRFQLAVPSRLNCYAFRIRARGGAVRDGRTVVRLRVEPASLLVRLIAPRVDVTLDVHSRHPVEYEGISTFGRQGWGPRYRARMRISDPVASPLAASTAPVDSGPAGGS